MNAGGTSDLALFDAETEIEPRQRRIYRPHTIVFMNYFSVPYVVAQPSRLGGAVAAAGELFMYVDMTLARENSPACSVPI